MIIKSFDLVVIGAGASGVNVAYEACKRGLQVALLDSGDIGGATSSRSTKLLHGGVRYLELAFKTLDFSQLKLVREALLERGYWLSQVPFLAKKLELILPTENCLEQSYFRLGLGLYDLLSGSQRIGNSRLLTSEEISRSLPLLKNKSCKGVAYQDGQFDDARLNLLIALTAERAGAVIRTYTKVIGFKFDSNGNVCGVISQNRNFIEEQWNAKVVVNATGICSDKIRQLADKNVEERMITSRGVHLVLESNFCPEGKGLLVPSTDDGRVLFILPFHNQTLLGTTDKTCNINEATKPSKEEENYLIDHMQKIFSLNVKPKISSSWAGGRPLLKPSQKSIQSSRLVREHEVEILPCGLISIMGGKWTTCRIMALDTIKSVERVLGKTLTSVKELPIIGTKSDPISTKELLSKQKEDLRKILPNDPISERQIIHLQSKYGLEALKIVGNSKPSKLAPLSQILPICEEEILHDIKKEHAYTSTDILARRSRLAMINIEEAKNILPKVQEQLIKMNLPSSEIDIQN